MSENKAMAEAGDLDVIVKIGELAQLRTRVTELEDAAQTVCAALDDAGRLHATTGGPELDAILRAGTTSEEES